MTPAPPWLPPVLAFLESPAARAAIAHLAPRGLRSHRSPAPVEEGRPRRPHLQVQVFAELGGPLGAVQLSLSSASLTLDRGSLQYTLTVKLDGTATVKVAAKGRPLDGLDVTGSLQATLRMRDRRLLRTGRGLSAAPTPLVRGRLGALGSLAWTQLTLHEAGEGGPAAPPPATRREELSVTLKGEVAVREWRPRLGVRVRAADAPLARTRELLALLPGDWGAALPPGRMGELLRARPWEHVATLLEDL